MLIDLNWKFFKYEWNSMEYFENFYQFWNGFIDAHKECNKIQQFKIWILLLTMCNKCNDPLHSNSLKTFHMAKM